MQSLSRKKGFVLLEHFLDKEVVGFAEIAKEWGNQSNVNNPTLALTYSLFWLIENVFSAAYVAMLCLDQLKIQKFVKNTIL